MKKSSSESNSLVTVNDFFKQVLCINLEAREDRRKETIEELSHYNIDFSFFNAQGPSIGHRLLPGEVGAFKSHLSSIKYVLQNRLDNVLILEDDVELCENFNVKFSECIQKVPEDWDMIYFGGNHESEPTVLEGGLLKCTQTFAIHCIGVRWTAYNALINICEANAYNLAVDYLYAELHKALNVYAFSPALAFQRVGYSDIQESVVDYTVLRRGHNAG